MVGLETAPLKRATEHGACVLAGRGGFCVTLFEVARYNVFALLFASRSSHKSMLVCQKGSEAQADIVLDGGGIVGGVVKFSGMLGYYHGGEGRGMNEFLQKAR